MPLALWGVRVLRERASLHVRAGAALSTASVAGPGLKVPWVGPGREQETLLAGNSAMMVEVKGQRLARTLSLSL